MSDSDHDAHSDADTDDSDGLFQIAQMTVDGDSVEHEEVRHFQSSEGRMPLNPVDTDARWRTSRSGKASGLQYQENVIVDWGGFILSLSRDVDLG